MNKEKNLILGILLLLGIITFSTAAGIGFSTYSTEYPLKMYPGQEATLEMELQLEEGQGITSFIAEEKEDPANVFSFVHENPTYTINSGERIKVPVRISVPTTANLGDTYLVWTTFNEHKASEGGMVNFISRLHYRFSILVVTEKENSLYTPEATTITTSSQEQKSSKGFYMVVSTLIILLIIGYLTYNKKKNK